MLLNLLRALGRMEVILDRGQSHPEFHHAKPWVERYYLIFKKRPRWFPFNLLIHRILDNDHGQGVHNHPCPYITVILTGGYWETLATGRYWRRPGYIGWRAADTKHRVDIKPDTTPITLFIQGPFGLRKAARSSYNDQFDEFRP